MTAPKEIVDLVEKFERNYKAYTNQNFKEEHLRLEFINPFFAAMGWDIDNTLTGAAPAYRDVIHEDSLTTKDGTTAPDYCFTLSGNRKFFVETKKPFVKITRDPEPARQLRKYAWSGRLPISILTNFEYFIIYSATRRTKNTDKANTEMIKTYHYKEFVEKWDEIASRFSKNAVVQGLFDKFSIEYKEAKGSQEVGDEFLKDIDSWREKLAHNIALRNRPLLNERELNSTVQKTIDRIIFLRMAEDRGVEKYKQMFDIAKGENIYSGLCKIFKSADEKYNSGIFHFTDERTQITTPDNITLTISIDDKVLKDILLSLYPPESPYAFSHLSPEILGNIYEQFLGKVIKIKGRSAIVEEKPDIKKAGGVYYTPQYIVDYIVENTVGKVCKGKTPNKISEIKILDPACGSGSFLLSAYSYLLKYHLNYYAENYSKSYQDYIYKGAADQWFLTVKEKKRILLNNIYGVDIDQQAVEVTKLSLLLKVLEGENKDVFEKQQKLWRERALPDLGNNIKCGNSIIGTDYSSNLIQKTLFDENELHRLNLFDWESEFAHIIASGKFDVVIGNPPYGASLTSEEREYLNKKYSMNTTDTAALMMVRAHTLTKDDGYNGFIVPKPFTYSSNWDKVRNYFRDELHGLVDVGKVWDEVKLEQIIYFIQKGKIKKTYRSLLRVDEEMKFPIDIPKEECERFGFFINGLTYPEIQLGRKIFGKSKFLGKYVTNTRGSGFQDLITENKAHYRAIGGKQIQRNVLEGQKGYAPKSNDYDSNAYVKPDSLLVQNIVAHLTKPIGHIKLISAYIDKGECDKVVILDTVNQLNNKGDMSSMYYMAFLHSKLVNWYVYRFIYAKAIRTMHFDGPVTDRVPLFHLDLGHKKEKEIHDTIVNTISHQITCQKKLKDVTNNDEKATLQRQIEYASKAIDQIVYKLYGLDESEINLIEEETRG